MAIIYPSAMPYDDLVYIDQSEYKETTPLEPTPSIPSGPIAFIPFVSPRGYGEDNKLMYMDSTRLAKYGNPNLKKYGLSLYLAKRFVEGGGSVLGMRLMPDDAGYANVCVYAEVTKADILPYRSDETGTGFNKKTVYYPLWTKATSDNKTENIVIPGIEFDGVTTDEGVLKNSELNFGNIKFGSNDTNKSFVTNMLTSLPENLNDVNDSKIYSFDAENATEVYLLPVKTVADADKITEITLYECTKDTNGKYKFTGDNDNPVVYATLKADERVVVTYKCKNSKITTNKPTTFAVTDDETTPTVITFDGKKYDANYYELKTVDDKSTIALKDTITVPMFIVKAKAKGSFAKDFRFKIVADDAMNAQVPSYFFYKFSDDENNSKLDGDMTFTFDDDYTYAGTCMSIEEVFSEYSANVEMIKCKEFEVFKDYIKENVYGNAVGSDATVDADTQFNKLDVLFGSNAGDKLVIDFSGCNLSTNTNLSGDELDGEIGNASFVDFGDENFKDPFSELFVKAYSGQATDLVYEEVRYPYEYLLIPSYDTEVMDAANDLVESRHITRAYFTYPKFSTYAAARVWARTNMAKYNTFKTSEYVEWAQVRDPYTNKKTMMPSTYFNAYHLPAHWIYNKGKPYAGTRNYRWSGFTVGTLTPSSTNAKEYIDNHKLGINTMVEDGLGYASPYEQITSKQKSGVTSQLCENNNATILMNMARIALRMASNARWTTLSDQEVTTFIADVQDSITRELSGTYKSLVINGERESVNGAGRNRIHCAFYVNFNDLFKGVTYEFYILAN